MTRNCLKREGNKGEIMNDDSHSVTTTTNYGIEQQRQRLFNSLQLSALEFVCFTCSYRTIGYLYCSISRVFVTKYNIFFFFSLGRGNARRVGDAGPLDARFYFRSRREKILGKFARNDNEGPRARVCVRV